MVRISGSNPVERIQALANDIIGNGAKIDGKVYWSKSRTAGIDTSNMATSLSLLVKAGVLYKRYVRRSEFLGKALPEEFFIDHFFSDHLQAKKLGVHLYVAEGVERLQSIANNEDVAMSFIGYRPFKEEVAINFEVALQRVRKEIKESNDPNALLVEVITRLLSKTP